jgi:phage regulatory protein, rha family
MNELQILGNENIMTSLEISEITGKRHNQILRDIRDEIEKLEKQGIGAEHIFVLGEYLDKNNQKRPMYSLTKEGVLQLAARYDAVVRFKLIEKATKTREYTQKELLLMQLESIEKIEKLQLENKQQAQQLIEQAPKIEFYNDVTGSETTAEIGTVAKILGFKNVGRNILFDILRKQGILKSDNIPYQKYVDNGYFRVIESKWNDYITGDVKISFKTVVYQKGIEYIAKLLRELGYQKIEVA